MYNMPPPAPLAAAPHAERVRGSIAIGLSGLGLYEDAQCRRETTVRIVLSPRGRSMQCKCPGLSAWPSRAESRATQDADAAKIEKTHYVAKT